MSSFQKALVARQRARAAIAEYDAGVLKLRPDEVDQVVAKANKTLRATEWKLLQTPATTFADISDRAEVVLDMFTAAEKDGVPTDGRHRLMLSALVMEIVSHASNAEN
jgi:hypothetical protein